MRANPGGNEQLTAVAGILLIVLLAVEGATLLNLRALLTLHAGLGLRLGIVAVMVVAGTAVAMATLPGADHLQDQMSAQVGIDSG